MPAPLAIRPADFPENREIIREFIEFCPVLATAGVYSCSNSNTVDIDSRDFENRELCHPEQGNLRSEQGISGFWMTRHKLHSLGQLHALIILLYRHRPISQGRPHKSPGSRAAKRWGRGQPNSMRENLR